MFTFPLVPSSRSCSLCYNFQIKLIKMAESTGDNFFKLDCSPKSSKLVEILNIASLSKDYAKNGFAKFLVTDSYDRVPKDEIKTFLTRNRNNVDQKVLSKFCNVKGVPWKPLSDKIKTKLLQELGNDKLKVIENAIKEKHCLLGVSDTKYNDLAISEESASTSVPSLGPVSSQESVGSCVESKLGEDDNGEAEGPDKIVEGSERDGDENSSEEEEEECPDKNKGQLSGESKLKKIPANKTLVKTDPPTTRSANKRKAEAAQADIIEEPKPKRKGPSKKLNDPKDNDPMKSRKAVKSTEHQPKQTATIKQPKYDPFSSFIVYGRQGESALKKIKTLETSYDLEELTKSHPTATEATITHLKALQSIRTTEYLYHYIKICQDIDLGQDRITPFKTFNRKTLGLKSRQLCTSVNQENLVPADEICPVDGSFGIPLSISPLQVNKVFGQPSINMHLGGGTKIWLIVPGEELVKLRSKLSNLSKLIMDYRGNVLEDLNHNRLVIQPELLDLFNVRYMFVEQNEGEIILTGTGAYHQRMDMDYNLSISVNVMPECFIQEISAYVAGENSKFEDFMCSCDEKSGSSCKKSLAISKILERNLYSVSHSTNTENLPTFLLEFQDSYLRLIEPLSPTQARLDLSIWLSRLYCNFCWYKNTASCIPGTSKGIIRQELYIESQPLVQLLNKSSLECHELKFLVVDKKSSFLTNDFEKIKRKFDVDKKSYQYDTERTALQHVALMQTDKSAPKYVCKTCMEKGSKKQDENLEDDADSDDADSGETFGIFSSYGRLHDHFRRQNFQYDCKEDENCHTSRFRKERIEKHIAESHSKLRVFCPRCFVCLRSYPEFSSHFKKCQPNLIAKAHEYHLKRKKNPSKPAEGSKKPKLNVSMKPPKLTPKPGPSSKFKFDKTRSRESNSGDREVTELSNSMVVSVRTGPVTEENLQEQLSIALSRITALEETIGEDRKRIAQLEHTVKLQATEIENLKDISEN